MSISDRGNGRGRGGGWRATQQFRASTATGRSPWASRKVPQGMSSEPEHPAQPLGPLLLSVRNTELTTSLEPRYRPAKITDCEYIASYSWLNEKAPTILLPGKPPAWTPLNEPRQLKEDSGDYFRDPNAARYPKHPTEPAVQAVLAEQPNFHTKTVDIFACGNTVGNLLRFVRAVEKPFRFNVEVIGNTVFFVRKEKAPTELIPNVRGYGHTFPESYTSWEPDVKGSESHQRIIRYRFGGIDCVIRFESDGYLRDLATAIKPGQSNLPTRGPDVENSLTLAMEAASVSSFGQKQSRSDGVLQIKSGGQPIPQKAVFDLKTRSVRAEIDMTEMYPRLWVSQIPNLIVAYHTRGTFEDIRKLNIRPDLDSWEEENQDALRRLNVLLTMIINYAKGASGAKLEICRTDLDVLQIREQAGNGCDALPTDVRSRWEQGNDLFNPTSSNPQEEDKNASDEETGVDLWASDDDFEPDFTACSEDCGYCGRCTY